MGDEVEAIRASDLLKLMKVVENGTGLYNSLEREVGTGGWGDHHLGFDVSKAFDALGESLRELGLMEVQR